MVEYVERAKMSTLTPDEVFIFLDAAKYTPYYVFFSTLICTGLRRGELLALRWRNLDLDSGTITVVETAYKLGNGEYISLKSRRHLTAVVVCLYPLH